MAYEEFEIGHLADLNGGKVKAGLERLVRNAVRDCLDRPAEKAARVVTLKLRITPQGGQDGFADSVAIVPKMNGTTPDYLGSPTTCNAKPSGTILFNKMAPDNPDQTTFDEQKNGGGFADPPA